jgi:hypothetical protein
MPNARRELLLEAGVRYERTLEAVSSTPLFGAGPAHDFRLGPMAPRPAVPARQSPPAACANSIPGFPAEEAPLTGDPGEGMREP